MRTLFSRQNQHINQNVRSNPGHRPQSVAAGDGLCVRLYETQAQHKIPFTKLHLASSCSDISFQVVGSLGEKQEGFFAVPSRQRQNHRIINYFGWKRTLRAPSPTKLCQVHH